MAGFQLSGLASGLDWKNLVDQLIEAERAPQTRLRQDQAKGTQKTNALESLKTQLTELQTAIGSLSGDTDIFGTRSAKVAGSTSTWSAAAAAGTETAAYVFNVAQLATKSQRVGANDVGGRLSSTSDVSSLTIGTLPIASKITAGDFSVNGAKITVATTDSLQDVLNQIATKTGGSVTASYDPTTDKVRLSSPGEIVLGSANDTSNFLGALQLYNNGTNEILPPTALGVVSVSAAIAQANLKLAISNTDGSGNGTFSINGVDIAFNTSTDSIQTIMNRINTSEAGVVATFDRVNDRFTLTNRTTGDTGVSVSESPGGLLQALGLNSGSTLNRGKNAQFSLDGGPTLVSASNNFDESVHGITGLSVTATTESAETVNVSGDTSGVRKKIEDFVAKYNAVQKYIDQQTRVSVSADGKVSSATLAGNLEVSSLGTQLRSRIFDAVPGLSGTVKRLEDIGIDFKSRSSELEIKDGGKLDAALKDNAGAVRSLFSGTGGVAQRIDEYIDRVSGATGSLTIQTDTIAKQSREITEQIATIERRLAQQRQKLETSFIQMEQAQQQIKSQLTTFNNYFGSSS